MAYTHVYDLTFIVEDSQNPSQISAPTIRVSVNDAELTWADLESLATTVRPIIATLINGHIRRAYASKKLLEWTGTAASNADVEEGALFVLEAVGTDKAVRLTIPTLDESYSVANTGIIDLSNADIITFTNLLVEGVTVNSKLVRVVDSEARPIISVKSANEVFSRSRKKRR